MPDNNLEENTIHILRSQILRNGMYCEEINVSNYGEKSSHFDLSITFNADFKDIFEIRGIERKVELQKPELRTTKNKIIFTYKGLDNIHRRTEIIFRKQEDYDIYTNTIRFHFSMKPNESQKISYMIYFISEEEFISNEEVEKNHIEYLEDIKVLIKRDFEKTRSLFTKITTSNEQFNHWLNRSRADLQSLLTQTVHGKYPYAGVPWYNTAFGRDGIITAMEVLWIAPEIARDTLHFLAEMQAEKIIPEKDAEPGKIMHELRTGEMANTGEIPFKEYYGTIDATPLFIMLAGMYYERTADIVTIEKIWPNIKAAIEWINVYGDIDKDGFVEYKHKAENGLTNQGWKDSHDSIMYEDGAFCKPPIALSEVQGYVYAAKKYASFLADVMEERDYAENILKEAMELKQKFNDIFWDDGLESYVLALDADKNSCRVLSSNPGHCLFTEIVKKKNAGKLVESLFSKELFSGWGIRTLGAKEKRYNPMSYHNGSIWPHDNALIAYGLSKYGFRKESLQIMQSLFEASLFIDLQRLPELFCGFDRRKNEGPTAYPVACSPQAWAVGAVFLLMQSCLRIQIDALNKMLVFDKPILPDYIDYVCVSGLQLHEDSCEFEMRRHKNDVGFNVIKKPKDWDLIIKK
jgi:glycogen debranching enzyme